MKSGMKKVDSTGMSGSIPSQSAQKRLTTEPPLEDNGCSWYVSDDDDDNSWYANDDALEGDDDDDLEGDDDEDLEGDDDDLEGDDEEDREGDDVDYGDQEGLLEGDDQSNDLHGNHTSSKHIVAARI
ncbi:hypothetical protein BS78_01G166400 [Paspalum vaginatum]|nr:hypothetical protein BS78_01G166400 [Paspalum vaginatum]